jgi:hypothetical protein
MESATLVTPRGTAYLVQYRHNPGRNEARNIGVALVAHDFDFAAIKHLPQSQFADRLRERGIVDDALVSLGKSLELAGDPAGRMERLRVATYGSLQVGDPMPTEIDGSPADVLSRLFKALVARPTSRRPGRTKADVLDRTVAAFRQIGAPVRVGQYQGDFLLDALVESDRDGDYAVHTQSFDAMRRDWSSVEHQAAHFLYAIGKLNQRAISVIEPPASDVESAATVSYQRIGRWLGDAGVEVASLSTLARLAARFQTTHQLPLIPAI